MSEASAPAVVTDNLSLAHGERLALEDVSLKVKRGQIVALIGPNGSGKSTLMNAIAGLHRPLRGAIQVFGQEPGSGPIAYVFQSTHVPKHLPLTVNEVITMGRYRRSGLLGRIGPRGRAAVSNAMERLQLGDLRNRQLQELSGGQRQRVLVAQGLAGEAELLMLDEPMTGLDPMARQVILDVVREEADKGRTVIFSTHDMREAELAGQVVLLAGRLISAGAPATALAETNLKSAYQSRFAPVGGTGADFIDDAHHHGDHHGDHHDHG